MWKRFVLLSVFLASVSLGHAELLGLPVLLPGTSVPNVDDLSAADHAGLNPAGSLFLDTGVQSFNFTGSGITTSGSVREVVYREAGGTLDFLVGVHVVTGGLSELSQVNTGNFINFSTRVGTLSPVALLGATGSLFPTTVSRTSGGDTVIFNFLNPLTAGESAVMVISTNATLAIGSNIGLIGAGGGTETVAGFQPEVVPEPATFGLLGMALVVVCYIQHRK